MDERRYGPAVVGTHPRAVGVEDPYHRGIDALAGPVGGGHGLGIAFGFVVYAPGPNGVDVAPVALLLRMDLRVAVDLRYRCQQELCLLLLGQFEGMPGAHGTGLECVDWQLEVVDRRCRRGEMEDGVDPPRDMRGFREIGTYELKVFPVVQVRDVGWRAGQEVVQAHHSRTLRKEGIAQPAVRPHPPGSSMETGSAAGMRKYI